MKTPIWSAILAGTAALIASLWLGALPFHDVGLSRERADGAHNKPAAYGQLTRLALQGSPEAATELIIINDECLGHTEPSEKKAGHCWQELRRWTEIGLKNGSPLAAQMKVNELLQSQSCADIDRAEYWFNRYKQAGAGNELMWKSDSSEIAKKKQSCAA